MYQDAQGDIATQGNDLSAPYVSVTGLVALKVLTFKIKDRPECLVLTFYDAMKAEFLPKHTGANLVAFHPDFTYRYGYCRSQ
jgi:hypothetical protein